MKIEHIVSGRILGSPKLYPDGQYRCYREGENMNPVYFSKIEDVADFLRTHARSGVRMTPSGSKIVKNIFIDGAPR